MANSKYTTRGTVAAEPEPIALEWPPQHFSSSTCSAISWSRRLWRDLAMTVATGAGGEADRSVLSAARQTGMLVVHTREGHLPDLSDAPPPSRTRRPSLRIGDPGRWGGS